MQLKLKEDMIMSLSKGGSAEKSFRDLSESISGNDKIMLETRLLMYRFLSEIDKITGARGINRKELAKLAGTSASYITQLYQGKKIINLQMLARIKKALDIDFKIEIVSSERKTKSVAERPVMKIAQPMQKNAAYMAVKGAHLPEKLIQSKSLKLGRRPQKTL
jgi:transcriptional regulator with XRE-family HTH domain